MFKTSSPWNPRDPSFTFPTLSVHQDSIPGGLGKCMLLIANHIYDFLSQTGQSEMRNAVFHLFLKLTFQHLTTFSL